MLLLREAEPQRQYGTKMGKQNPILSFNREMNLTSSTYRLMVGLKTFTYLNFTSEMELEVVETVG